jgi:hypothetical protein
MTVSSTSTRSTGLVVAGLILTVLGLLGAVVGLGWVVVFYATQGLFPVGDLGSWNLLIGGLQFLGGVLFLIVGLVLIALGRRKPTQSAARKD